MSELAKTNTVASLDAEALILKAVESQVPVETMERLLAMRKDLKQEQAKEAYYAALARFQSICPIIKKTKEVKDKSGKVRYRYEPLDGIIAQVKDTLKQCDLSYTFRTLPAVDTSGVDVVCETSHILGFTQTSSVHIDIDQEAFMNQAQKSGSALTYAKRYAFCNAFGILTSDEDDDGASAGGGLNAQDLYRKFSWHMKTVMENFDTVFSIKSALQHDDYDMAAMYLADIDDFRILQGLRMAPTKGGCFTVEEAKKMKTTEFQQAYMKYREGREMVNV